MATASSSDGPRDSGHTLTFIVMSMSAHTVTGGWS